MRTRLVALDFDGTLAPLRRDPAAVRLPARRRARLARLSAAPGTRVLIVSGRPLAFLRRALAGSGAALAGDHGWEVLAPGWRWRHPRLSARRAQASALARALRRACGPWRGTRVELKTAAVVVHYRTSAAGRRDPAALRRALLPLRPRGWRLEGGKMIWEFRPGERWGKAEAIRLAARRWRARELVFLGDDATDEEAFRRLPRAARTVKVGPGRTAARERVASPAGVDRLLDALSRA